MIHGDDAVAEISRRAGHGGLFLDVDGTLAPIVARPELARVLPEIPPPLARLVGRFPVVASISGRPAEEVRALIGVEGVVVVGTHGLEDECRPDAAAPLLRPATLGAVAPRRSPGAGRPATWPACAPARIA